MNIYCKKLKFVLKYLRVGGTLMGKFIVFEGIDGSGKSTQSDMLCNKLKSENILVTKTFEPTNGEIGTLLRKYLRGEISTDKKVLAGLFASDRLDHFLNAENGIIKLISDGYTVICDRNYLSNFAYQADEDENFVPMLNQKARELLKPDIHIYVDVSIDVALERISKSREDIDVFENKQSLLEVTSNYKKIFKQFKNEENILIVDGNKSVDEVAEDIFNKISYLFDA